MFEIGDEVQVVPKTNKAKNRVREGLGKTVVIIDSVESCQALNNSPAYLIAPKGQPLVSSPHSRWVKKQADADFRLIGA